MASSSIQDLVERARAEKRRADKRKRAGAAPTSRKLSEQYGQRMAAAKASRSMQLKLAARDKEIASLRAEIERLDKKLRARIAAFPKAEPKRKAPKRAAPKRAAPKRKGQKVTATDRFGTTTGVIARIKGNQVEVETIDGNRYWYPESSVKPKRASRKRAAPKRKAAPKRADHRYKARQWGECKIGRRWQRCKIERIMPNGVYGVRTPEGRYTMVSPKNVR